jgi:magnesium-transporting ATPase (P-type)
MIVLDLMSIRKAQVQAEKLNDKTIKILRFYLTFSYTALAFTLVSCCLILKPVVTIIQILWIIIFINPMICYALARDDSEPEEKCNKTDEIVSKKIEKHVLFSSIW